MLSLQSHQIDLWLTFDNEVPEHMLLSYQHLLRPDELARANRFYFKKHRRQFVISRALRRTVLAKYLAQAPGELRFKSNAFGKPHLNADEAGARTLDFNISHTEGLILCGVTRGTALGVDVEEIRHRQVSPELADRFFSKRETDALRILPSDLRRDLFFHYWTLKEAYIKAKGKGLSMPLDSFWFNFAKERRIEIGFEPDALDRPGDWHLWLLQPSPNHIAAICARTAPVPLELRMRIGIPLLAEAWFNCPVFRQSG